MLRSSLDKVASSFARSASVPLANAMMLVTSTSLLVTVVSISETEVELPLAPVPVLRFFEVCRSGLGEADNLLNE